MRQWSFNRMGRLWRRRLVAAGIATLMVGTGLAVATTAQAAAGCRVAYSVPSQWPGGFTANVNITNLGDPINGWRLVWTFPSGQQVTQAWNATITPSGGTVTATNMSYNAAIATNATVSFGFNGSWSGSNTVPASFTLNGVICTGSVGGTTHDADPARPPRRPPRVGRRPPRRPPRRRQPTNRDGDGRRDAARLEPGQHLRRHRRRRDLLGQPARHHGPAGHHQGAGLQEHPDPGDLGPHQRRRAELHHRRGLPQPGPGGRRLGAGRRPLRDDQHSSRLVAVDQHDAQPTARHVLTRYNALWTQLAAAFRNHSSRLVFESVNEPQFTGSSGDAQNYQLLHELNASFRSIVRASGGNNATRLLVLPTLHTNADQGRVDALVSDVQPAQRPEPRRDVPLLRVLAVQREHRRLHPVRRRGPGRPGRHVRPRCTTPSSPAASR